MLFQFLTDSPCHLATDVTITTDLSVAGFQFLTDSPCHLALLVIATLIGWLAVSIPDGQPLPFSHKPRLHMLSRERVSIPDGQPLPFSPAALIDDRRRFDVFQFLTDSPCHLAGGDWRHKRGDCSKVSIPDGQPLPFSPRFL